MEKVIEINSKVLNNKDNVITFENGYRIVWEIHQDCCACVVLEDIEKIFNIGEYIQKIKVSYTLKKQVFLRSYNENNEEIYCSAFYNENNGYYAPWTQMVIYNEKKEIIFKEILDDENVSWE